METRSATRHVYYSMTKSLCGACKRGVDAKIQFRDGRVVLDKFCTEHGKQVVEIASSVEWYLDSLSFLAPNTPPAEARKDVTGGCPFDCGPCPSHRQRIHLPVVPITSSCNLDCPICYTINRNEGPHRTTRDEMRGVLEALRRDHTDLDIINFTGGEPTMHPELPEFLELCREAGIRRLTVSTNGLALLDEAYVRRMAELDARIVLSFDTFRPETDKVLLGANTVRAKTRVLDLLERYDVACTILPAIAAGVNDGEVGDLLQLVLERRNVRSLELHTMTFTGQGGSAFGRAARISIPDLHRRLEEATAGRITGMDFVPSPLAHPHCYSISYLLLTDGGGYVPFTRFMPRAKLYELLEDSLYLEPREKLDEVFRGILDELWSDPERLPESREVLATLKRLLKDLFPTGRTVPMAERQRIAERTVKAIYIHSHMDEENFDVGRVMKCCVAVPEPDGTAIPTCSYNVLYRERDPRFARKRVAR